MIFVIKVICLKTKYVGFPIMKYWENDERNESYFHSKFFERLVGINDLEEADLLNQDVILQPNLDNDDDPEFFIDVKRNETLVKER